MRFSRVALRLAVAVPAVLGMGLASAGTASATEVGVWRAYGNTNPITSSPSTWRCGRTVPLDQLANLKGQVCAVRSVNGRGVQVALIVRNNYGATLDADVEPGDLNLAAWPFGGRLDSVECTDADVAANSWSVCFGSTISHGYWVVASEDHGFFPASPPV